MALHLNGRTLRAVVRRQTTRRIRSDLAFVRERMPSRSDVGYHAFCCMVVGVLRAELRRRLTIAPPAGRA